MSKFKGILKSVTSILGLSAPKVPALPVPQVAAAPAPVSRTDTGANIIIGSDDVKNQRVSGAKRKASAGANDFIGGMGGGSGISI